MIVNEILIKRICFKCSATCIPLIPHRLSLPCISSFKSLSITSQKQCLENAANTRNEHHQSGDQKNEERKKRKRYALGGCLVTMFLSTHAILLWRRRSEFRTLNVTLPPIKWETFRKDYLIAGKVKSIVYQPHFHVGDVYLQLSDDDEREKLKRHFLSTFRAGPEKFARTPDVRFGFDDDCDAFEKALENALSGAEKSCDVHLEINRFPSYRELAFICISTLFTLAAVGLMKI